MVVNGLLFALGRRDRRRDGGAFLGKNCSVGFWLVGRYRKGISASVRGIQVRLLEGFSTDSWRGSGEVGIDWLRRGVLFLWQG